MKRSMIIIIAAAALIVIAACTLVLTGVIRLPWKKQAEPEEKPVFYIEYTDSYMLVSAEDQVIAVSDERPEGIPEISGVSFSSIIIGQTLTPTDEAAFSYAKKILDAVIKSNLGIGEIYITSDLQAIIYVNNVRILLGDDEQTDEKIKDLNDFFDDVKDLSGTLDMKELSHNNSGYTFKVSAP